MQLIFSKKKSEENKTKHSKQKNDLFHSLEIHGKTKKKFCNEKCEK